MERYIAIDNVCAWPNLTLLPGGEIVAIIFNQPCHGRWEGDAECWGSADGGRTWQRRGAVTQHEPGTARFDLGAGLARDGALVCLVSGAQPKLPPPPPGTEQPVTYTLPRPARFPGTVGQMVVPMPERISSSPGAEILAPWVCRSVDGGRTWSRSTAITLPQGRSFVVPFGKIQHSSDGSLALMAYWEAPGDRNALYLLFSRDDGKSWGESTLIGTDIYNETDLLILDQGRWLIASRTVPDHQLDLLASADLGHTWTLETALTLPYQHPASLLRLADGRIVLTYGIRNHGQFAIAARLSADQGHSWGPPLVLVDLDDATDGGYPSSVQLPDGTIVTAYYANRTRAHRRYHMGVVRWRAEV